MCGVADLNTGWVIYMRGQTFVIGGTSAVSPMWSALWSNFLGTGTRKCALPRLYNGYRTNGYHDVLTGNNGAYNTTSGYDLCTGMGSPDGTNLKPKVQ